MPVHGQTRTVQIWNCDVSPLFASKQNRFAHITSSQNVFKCGITHNMCTNVCTLYVSRMYLNIVPICITHIEHGSSVAECQNINRWILGSNPHCSVKGKEKVWFYIALYPVRWTAQSALHFPPLADLFIPTPFSASLGSILAMQQLRAKTKSLTFPPLSIARYSFIQLGQLGRREVKENAQTSKQ